MFRCKGNQYDFQESQESRYHRCQGGCSTFFFRSKIMAVLLASTILVPFASFLYPRAEDTLRKQGLRQEIVQELAPGQKIRVEDGWIAALMDDLPFIGANLIFKRGPNAATRGPYSLFNPSSNCIVNMRTLRSFRPEKIISTFSHGTISKKEIRNSPFNKEEMFNVALLHEIRHCSKDNAALTSLEREGDADYHSVTILAGEFKNPEIITWAFNMRASRPPTEEAHDVSLYLDARLKGETPPSTVQIKEANKEAGKFISSGSSDSSSLSQLAHRRVELYREAQNYFRNPPKAKLAVPKIS